MKRRPSPLKLILKDLQQLAELANEGCMMLPDFHRDRIHRQVTKIIGKYVVTRRAVNKAIKTATKK